ncbi:ATP-dependent nuclease [Viscerimonas tarda]
MYIKHDDDNKLPEHYNGIGYMNLICMIFEIEILIQEFKREKEKKTADINLLFIEEPEAHTHPQMQYIFIKNIKKLLKEGIQREDGEKRKLQYIVSTHSSHIVADSDFDDIKYLKKEDGNSVVAKNLKELKKEYDENTTQYQFLTQYLTISRAEIFFAEKAVLIEGDTERMLIPTIMKKIDIEEEAKHRANNTKDDCLPLLSQNVSIVEVGAYSQIFDKFIEFLGIKTLVITDLDAVGNNGKRCEVAQGVSYSNDAISHYFNSPALASLKGYSLQDKLFNNINGNWVNQPNGKLCVVYQTDENGYNARSFEDAFIHLNRDFVKDNKANFRGLQNREDFDVDANIEEIINDAHEKGICLFDEKLEKFQAEKAYIFNRVKDVKYSEFQKLFDYLEGKTPFSTQHKTKGTEFDNVLVILDNGNWNNYNFENLFLGGGTQSVLERTQKIFYVCCTRAKENLAVFYHNPSQNVINQAKVWFEKENVFSID